MSAQKLLICRKIAWEIRSTVNIAENAPLKLKHLYFWRGYDYCCFKFVSTSHHIRINKLLSEWFSSSLLSRLYFPAVNIWWYVGNNKFSEQKTITSFSPKLSIDIFLHRFDYFCQEAQTAAAAAPTQQNSVNKTSRHISNQLIRLWMKLMRDSRRWVFCSAKCIRVCVATQTNIYNDSLYILPASMLQPMPTHAIFSASGTHTAN